MRRLEKNVPGRGDSRNEGLECEKAAEGQGPVDRGRLQGSPGAATGLRIRGRVPSHCNRREREKQIDRSRRVCRSEGRKLRKLPSDGFYFLSEERERLSSEQEEEWGKVRDSRREDKV